MEEQRSDWGELLVYGVEELRNGGASCSAAAVWSSCFAEAMAALKACTTKDLVVLTEGNSVIF